MLFQRRFHDGLLSGEITLTFRRWSAPRVKVGGRYGCPPIGLLEVDEVDRLAIGDITEVEARRSGFESRGELITFLEKTSRAELGPEAVVYRVALRHAGPDDRPPPALDRSLSSDEIGVLIRRLAAMDGRSSRGAWTEQTLRLLDEHPRTAASRLSQIVDCETRRFKTDVRKLKRIGLTRSFEVGYELTAGGREVLSELAAERVVAGDSELRGCSGGTIGPIR